MMSLEGGKQTGNETKRNEASERREEKANEATNNERKERQIKTAERRW